MKVRFQRILLLVLAALFYTQGVAKAIASEGVRASVSEDPEEIWPGSRPEPSLAGEMGTLSQMQARLSGSGPGSPFGNFSLRDDGIYYGPPIVGGAYQPDAFHSQSSYPTFLRNYLALSYAISSQWLVGAAFVSDVFPNGQTYLAPIETTSDKYMAIDDCFIRAMAPKLIHTAHFTTSADFRLYAPTSYLSRDLSGQGYSFQARFVSNYNFSGSRWSAGAIAKNTVYFTHYAWASAENGAMINDAYLGPMVNYQVSPVLAVGLFAEFDTQRYVGNQGFFDYTINNPENPTPWDLEPNLSWDITSTVNLNPFLQIYPGGRVTWDQIQVGALFGMKLF